MKKNLGFTLVELIVSFVIISVLSLVIFRTVVSIQAKQLRNLAYNSFVTFHNSINTAMQKDLTNKIITELEFCGVNCYKIKYLDATVKTLTINPEKRIIEYGPLKERLPKSFTFYRDIQVEENNVTTAAVDKYNSILTIRIPIESTILPGKQDLIYIYQFDNRVNDIKSTVS